ncbi:MAG: preprotein translocase subunit SecE [Clostridiales Family XIII bacterium]|jgi:preprotein translocase subunit SecE|nr:preprotein translocase subunit SecE [Clostridiales Family XIII bacterium]
MPGKDKDKKNAKNAPIAGKAGKKEKGANKSALAKAAASAKGGDTKKRRTVNAEARKGGGLKEYFKGVKIETKKVVWPTRRELISYTVVVLFTCAFFGLMIWGVDTAFLAALRKLLGIDL